MNHSVGFLTDGEVHGSVAVESIVGGWRP
jgi:hypothetical protein